MTPDRFNSEFKAFCHIARLALPVLQKKYVYAGQILEPKIIDNLQEFYTKKLLKSTIIKHIEAKDVDYDYFKNLDIIGGVPDALAENEKIVFEIKTTNIKNYDSWTLNGQANKLKKDGVPLGYKKQAQLYASLLRLRFLYYCRLLFKWWWLWQARKCWRLKKKNWSIPLFIKK
nr:hypothetical protein [Mycoplasmopsis bovis]